MYPKLTPMANPMRTGHIESVENNLTPRPVATAWKSLTLPFQPPFDWAALVGFLGSRAIPGVEKVEGAVYRRTISLCGQPGILSLEMGEDAFQAEISGPAADHAADHADGARARLGRLLDLGADPAAIAAVLGRDPLLAPAVAARPGLRVPGAWDSFELGIRAVLGQQVSVAGASTLAGRLVLAHGAALPPELAGDGLTHLFPLPAHLATADLVGLGLPGARARTLSGLGAAVLANPELFETGDLAADLARLTALRGIGPWSANYIAMRALRHGDAFPAGDLGLLRALGGAGPLPSHASLATRAEAWRPFRAYAALHLWTSVDPGPSRRPPHPVKGIAKGPVKGPVRGA